MHTLRPQKINQDIHSHLVTSNLGSRYLLKQTVTNRARVPDRAIELALVGLALEERGDCFERIAFNYQPLLLRAAFTLSALRSGLLRHLVLLSHPFLSGDERVPQPGIEPGRPNWALGCKPSLTANSSTGGYRKTLNAGTVKLLRGLTVPAWFFRPFSAALLPLPWCSSRSPDLSHNREQIRCNLPRFRNSGISQSVTPTSTFTDYDYVAVGAQFIKHSINAANCQASGSVNALHDFPASDRVILSQYLLPVEQQKNRIVPRIRACSQRYNAVSELHDFVETLIDCGSLRLRRDISIRCGCRNNCERAFGGNTRTRFNQFLESRELRLHDLYGASGFKLISAQFYLQTIGVIHRVCLSYYDVRILRPQSLCVKAIRQQDFHREVNA